MCSYLRSRLDLVYKVHKMGQDEKMRNDELFKKTKKLRYGDNPPH